MPARTTRHPCPLRCLRVIEESRRRFFDVVRQALDEGEARRTVSVYSDEDVVDIEAVVRAVLRTKAEGVP
jgi:hypothetical protein